MLEHLAMTLANRFYAEKAMIYWICSVDTDGSDKMICILMQYLNKGYDADHLEI